MRYFLFLTVLVYSNYSTYAQSIDVSSLPFNYSQDFNTLASSGSSNTWDNGTTLEGWYARNEDDVNDYTTYKAGSGTSSLTDLYSFGTGASDRALGTLNQNSSGDIAFGVLFENSSSVTINSVTIAFTVEQWRRVETNTRGFQRVQLAYQIANSVDVSASGLLTGDFTNIPEGYLIALDSTTINASEALDGNTSNYMAEISLTLPIFLADGQEFFLRFYDENVGDLDLALAVDDLDITFSADVVAGISGTSDYDVSHYLDASIITDIPEEGDGFAYNKVTEADFTALQSLFDDFYSADYANAAISADAYDYVVVDLSANGMDYKILRKESTSSYYWGTFLINTSPTQANTAILAPHPIKDFKTGKQAVAVFDLTQASDLMVAGISRCTSLEEVECAGTTSICGASGNFRISDVAHNDSTAFHLAATALSAVETNSIFIQLHGFEQEMGDPEFIFSNGSEDTPATDHLADLQMEFQSSLPGLDVDVVHLDGATKLKAFTNVLGRTLNDYPSDICTSGTEPVDPTGRFLHLEQYKEFRENPENYDDLADIISNSLSVVLPIELLSFSVEINDRQEAKLTWDVAWEYNVSHYEVECTIDGRQFDMVAKLGSLNSASPRQYTLLDAQPIPGVSYYRLRSVDHDGSYQYSELVRAEVRPDIMLYPNPVLDKLYLKGLGLGQSVKLISMSGQSRIAQTESSVDGTSIDMAGLPPGLYIVETGRTAFKIVKR